MKREHLFLWSSNGTRVAVNMLGNIMTPRYQRPANEPIGVTEIEHYEMCSLSLDEERTLRQRGIRTMTQAAWLWAYKNGCPMCPCPDVKKPSPDAIWARQTVLRSQLKALVPELEASAEARKHLDA